MKRALIIEFTKMTGAGNDFIVLDNRFYEFSLPELSMLARQSCPRRTGIGADGILALAAPTHAEADYGMIYVNTDGSEGTMCGNGARCLARFARESGFNKTIALMQTASGLCEVHVPGEVDASVRIYLDAPRNYHDSPNLANQVPDGIRSVHYLWPGTEHLVCLVADVSQLPLSSWGAALRSDPMLGPAGANINFVAIDPNADSKLLHVRTYEKGVEAETLACGTGAIASAVVAHKSGLLISDTYIVQMPGGVLKVGLETDRVYLEGPADKVYRGSMELTFPLPETATHSRYLRNWNTAGSDN